MLHIACTAGPHTILNMDVSKRCLPGSACTIWPRSVRLTWCSSRKACSLMSIELVSFSFSSV